MSFFGNLTNKLNQAAEAVGKAVTTPVPPTTGTATVIQPTNSYEASFNNQYVGCYRDNPTQSYMPKELPNVNDIGTCITNAKNLGYQYAAISNGNKCYASNHQDFAKGEMVDRSLCNIACGTPNTGNCGGTFINQVYKTGVAGKETFGLIKTNGDYITYFLVIVVLVLLYYELSKRNVI